MHVTDTLEMMERAYDDWKEGRWSRAPYIDMLIPSQIDPTMAPDGKHYMSVFVQYCPYRLADGEWNAEKRQAFGDTVIDTIARHSPNFKDLILHAEIRTPSRHRERGRADRGQHLPGRADLGSAAVQPAGAGLRAIPRAGARHVHVRLQHASGRRRHGRARRQRGARRAARSRRRPVTCAAPHALRLHRHRRRSQRTGVRRVPGARSGRSVLVLEAARTAGRRRGHARVCPGLSSLGLRAPAASDAAGADARAGSGAHGLKLARAASADAGAAAEGAARWRSRRTTSSALARASAADAAQLRTVARAVAAPGARTAPGACPPRRRGSAPMPGAIARRSCGIGWQIRRLGRRDMRELLRIGGMNVYDLLEEHFDAAAAQGRARLRCRARHQFRSALAGHRADAAVSAGGRVAAARTR